MKMRYRSNKGFIALMSVVIVSAVLMVVVAAASAASFSTRFNVLDQENKNTGAALAKACVQKVLIEAAQDSRYESVYQVSGQETAGNGKVCRFCAQKGMNSFEFSIGVRSEYFGAYTNLEVVAILDKSEKNFDVISWKETGTYAGPCAVP